MRSTSVFREVYREGQKIPGRYFLLFLRPRKDDVVRFGVTATRRIGNAVIRNRAKRIMREALRQTAPRINQGLDIIMVARFTIRSVGMNAIKMQLNQKLWKQNCLCGHDRGVGG
ncbi:ribonuclease P protein component [bacterium]|nr:ribonuclease P protein component [bacterium]